jgi:hypothetical protein
VRSRRAVNAVAAIWWLGSTKAKQKPHCLSRSGVGEFGFCLDPYCRAPQSQRFDQPQQVGPICHHGAYQYSMNMDRSTPICRNRLDGERKLMPRWWMAALDSSGTVAPAHFLSTSKVPNRTRCVAKNVQVAS